MRENGLILAEFHLNKLDKPSTKPKLMRGQTRRYDRQVSLFINACAWKCRRWLQDLGCFLSQRGGKKQSRGGLSVMIQLVHERV